MEKCSRIILVKSGFLRFAEDSFGHTMQSSECLSLLRCTRDITPHLWGLNVVDASLRRARVGTRAPHGYLTVFRA